MVGVRVIDAGDNFAYDESLESAFDGLYFLYFAHFESE